MPFLRIRQPNHRCRLHVRTGGDHLLYVGELQRAVLHFKPREIVMFRPFAIVGDVHLRLCETEDLLTLKQLLLHRVVERSLGSAGIRGLRFQRERCKSPQ